MLTLEQRIYLIQCYGTGDKCYRAVISKFNRRYPEVRVSHVAVRKLVRKFLETGSVLDIKRSRKGLNEDDAASVLALHSVTETPKLSLRRRALQIGISKSHLQRIFKENRILPFKPQFRHALEDGDDAKRLDFCLWVGNKILENRNFHKLIMFSDESTFSTNGVVSSQHCRYWSENNPHFTITAHSQYFKKVNVWCAVSFNGIIGPYFFNRNLNQETYLDMLENFLNEKLDELNLNYYVTMFFQQDGCPAHYAVAVRDWLTRKFQDKWIERNGKILCPPWSPDLTIMDFYLWERLKQIVYSEPLDNDEEQLKLRIQNAVQSLSLEEIRKSFNEFRYRVEVCADKGGALIE